jgi:hypothetical protein
MKEGSPGRDVESGTSPPQPGDPLTLSPETVGIENVREEKRRTNRLVGEIV